MGIVRGIRGTAGIATAVLLLSVASTPIALAAPVPASSVPAAASAARGYASCTALRKSFPTGLARDAKARAAAVKAGNRAPKVSTSAYLANARRLDKDRDGIICPVRASGTTPTPPADPLVPENPAFAATAAAVHAAGATCMVVRKGGEVIGEWYWDGRTPASQSTGFSTLKALAGTLVGIAQTQGKLSLDQPASDFISSWKGTASEGVTIRQLLNMTSGRASSPNDAFNMVLGGSPTAFALAQGQAAPPGTTFTLSDSAMQSLAAVLAAATGQSVIDFAKANLLTPLGMTSTTLTGDGANYANLAFDYATNCRDLARLSQLYLNGGTWNGVQVLSADYVAAARAGSAANSGYGFLFNLNTPGSANYYPGAPADAFSFIGDCGQVSATYPSSGVTMTAMTSSTLFDALSCDPTGAKVSAISQAFAAAPK